MTRSAQGSIATIDQFIAQVGQVKTASEKAADGSTPLSEPGSIGGETSHPVKKVDDRLEKAKEGERSAENSKDVKADQGAPSVENAAEASTKNAAARSIFGVAAGFAKKAEGAVSTPGSAADDHISTTTKVSPTGEDPAHETGSAKAGKEDKKQGGVGGTSHPASTENDQLDGHKYANDSLEKLAADMRNVGNNLLAQLHNVYTGSGVQAPQQTKQAAATNPVPQNTPQIDPRLAYYAGSELAGLMNGTMDKNAADRLVHDTLTSVIKQASDDADLFINYAGNFFKRAEGEDEGASDPTAGGGGEEAAAPAPGGAGGGGGGGGEDEMMAALGGGAGGDPMGGAGGGGGDPMGGGMGGGQDEEAAKLGLILEQLGITPEELQQAMAEQGMGGGDPMGGGAPGGGGDPMAAMGGAGGGGGAPPGGGMETQANAGGGKRNVAAPNAAIKQAEVANYIREVVSRSRAKR